jgi:hypothetical protein
VGKTPPAPELPPAWPPVSPEITVLAPPKEVEKFHGVAETMPPLPVDQLPDPFVK